jgi:hypothetical protein
VNPDSVKRIVRQRLRDTTEVCPYTLEKIGYFWDSWLFKMGPIDCPETSVRNYRYTVRNSPEALSSLIGYMFVA